LGQSVAKNDGEEHKDDGTLVEEYKDCSLSVIFADITKQVVDAVEGKRT